MFQILIITLLAGACTGLGGLVVLLYKPTDKNIAFTLASAAGIMLGVTLIALVPEGLECSYNFTVLGLVIGAVLLLGLDILLPHIHTTIRKRTMLTMGILVTIGIAIHDLPEGLAIGVSWAKFEKLGLMLALAIALHNIPEGVAVACALRASGVSKSRSVALAFGAGLPTFFGALFGLLFEYVGITYLALGLGFAAGAMLYVTVDELIPQAYKLGKGHTIAGCLIFGLALGALIALI